MTLQHQLSEFHPNANGRRACRLANRYLAERAAADEMWREQVTDLYLRMLEVGHKMGVEGSLIVAKQAVQQ